MLSVACTPPLWAATIETVGRQDNNVQGTLLIASARSGWKMKMNKGEGG